MSKELIIHSATTKGRVEVATVETMAVLKNFFGLKEKNAAPAEEVPETEKLEAHQPGTPLSFRGKNLSITIARILFDVEAVMRNAPRSVALIQVIYHNLQHHPIAHPTLVMVDSEGFQHSGSQGMWGLEKIKIEGNVLDASSLETMWGDIKDQAKSRGWILFEVDQKAIPQRLIFSLPLFPNGQTSGLGIGYETIEFFIKSYSDEPGKPL